jgi:membrane-anchored protein YejM (alkaline phosphatase superfamily)
LPSGFGLFVIFSWLHMLTVTWGFFKAGNTSSGIDHATVFHFVVWLTYSFVYLLPAIILAMLVAHILPRWPRAAGVVAVVATSLCILLIRADSVIYDLYNFHFNGFVLNLILTPGGVESLGGGGDTYFSIALIFLWHVLVQVAVWFASGSLMSRSRVAIRWRWVLAGLVLLMLGERLAYGFADLRNDGRFLDAIRIYPLYSRTKIRSLAAQFGIKPAERQRQVAVDSSQGRLNYPSGNVIFAAVERPLNIVLLVAESLRWDRLSDQTMPNTWKLAQKGLHFTRHYSSGNGTREALFGMFYGLYGSYWSSFLYAQKGPLLIDRLKELGYQFDLRTSAKFTYPEFDRTLFAGIPADQLHESKGGNSAWKSDELNTDALIDFLKNRDHNRPFMSFFFLESTHARYAFPESAAIAKPYLEDVNYASMSRESLAPKIDQLLNRYTNSAHWIDRQLGRIYAELERQDLLRDTIVIVTGDHGEEFMEKEAWGHNSSFVDEQIRTPMVVWMPGEKPRRIDQDSSHLDIGTTLLRMLGAPADAKAYSLGRHLLEIDERPFVVSSDWHSIGVITRDMKYRIPYTNRGVEQWVPTGRDDVPYAKEQALGIIESNQPFIMEAIRNCSRFLAIGK